MTLARRGMTCCIVGMSLVSEGMICGIAGMSLACAGMAVGGGKQTSGGAETRCVSGVCPTAVLSMKSVIFVVILAFLSVSLGLSDLKAATWNLSCRKDRKYRCNAWDNRAAGRR